jgi:hypothetical protein
MKKLIGLFLVLMLMLFSCNLFQLTTTVKVWNLTGYNKNITVNNHTKYVTSGSYNIWEFQEFSNQIEIEIKTDKMCKTYYETSGSDYVYYVYTTYYSR